MKDSFKITLGAHTRTLVLLRFHGIRKTKKDLKTPLGHCGSCEGEKERRVEWGMGREGKERGVMRGGEERGWREIGG